MTELDHNAITGVLAGDLEKYREIVRRYEADVFRAVAPAIGSRSGAEDLVQDVFVLAYRNLDKFDQDRPFRLWLMGLAKNCLRNELRRRGRESVHIEIYARHVEEAVSRVDAEGGFDFTEALAACRERLADTAERAIAYRYDDGLSLDVVAERLNCTVTAARQLLYRVRLTLRDCITAQRQAFEGNV